jgi:hypothetical protein
MVVQHPADMLRMVHKVDHDRPDAKPEYIAKPLSGLQLKAKRVAQESI